MSIRAYMAIMAERDAAIRERNMALEERKKAFAERDMAMLQRDAAVAERNSAMQERDDALAALQFQENSMNDINITPDSPGDMVAHAVDDTQNPQQQAHHMAYMAESTYSPSEIPSSSNFLTMGEMLNSAKHRKVKHTKEECGEIPTKSARSIRLGKNEAVGRSNMHLVSSLPDSGKEQEFDNAAEDDTWKDNLGLNQVNFDESSMPVPVCSCTGVPQPCYKWGNGGWQSACCTTTVSMYPLPQASGKRYSRVGGRKMSASVFTKLLNRLVAEGHDMSAPVDLRDHWSKHGTNRFITLK